MIFAFILCFITLINGHTYFSSLVINGVAQAEFDCVRPLPSSNYNYPISTVTSSDMTCGYLPQASQAANRKCSIPAGANVGIQWHYEQPGSLDTYIIDPSHRGPCMVYLAKSDTGSNQVWFKIFEDGYNTSTNQFCVDKLLANRGLLNFKIPSDLSPGNYLLRGEIIALHGAYASGGSQPYVHCAEITITGSGTSNPTSDYLVSFPGAYTVNDPGILLSIYQPISNYIVPGPKVYTGSKSSTSTSTSTSSSSSTTKQLTTGKVTTGRIVTSGSTTGRIVTSASTTGSIVSVTTGNRVSVTTGNQVSVTTATIPSVTTGANVISSVTTGTSQTNPTSNTCAGSFVSSISQAVMVSIDAWGTTSSAQYRAVIEIHVQEEVLSNWYLEVIFPSNQNRPQLTSAVNGGNLKCQSSLPAYHAIIQPNSWTTTVTAGTTIVVEIQGNNLSNLNKQAIMANTRLQMLKRE